MAPPNRDYSEFDHNNIESDIEIFSRIILLYLSAEMAEPLVFFD